MMEAYLYTYKLSILDGKPPRRWLLKARWYLLKPESTPRFKSVLNIIENYQIPKILLNQKEFILVKCEIVSEFLTRMVPDLLYDAILTPEIKKDLELSNLWNVEKIKLDKRGIALWKLGLQIKAVEKISVVKDKFKAILEEMKV
jgi:hypothetical protein